MLPLERKQEIVKMLVQSRSVKVADLSAIFNVTEETIRRDMEKLEREGLLKRTYGGAVLLESPGEDMPFAWRVKEHTDEKRRLAGLAVEFIKDGDTIMLDSSTTALEVAKALGEERQVTLITNSVNVCVELAHHKNCRIISTGGILNAKTMSFEGPTAVKNLSAYYADKAIFSCKGIDLERGVMESSEYEAEIKKRMIQAAKRVVLVVDGSKFEKMSLVKIDDFSHVDVLVTDRSLDGEWMEQMERHGIQVVVAREGDVPAE
ncbi:DeoR/GlpR family DNA-binding transcription regulator [Anaerotalea alkaliphila]|uniref:DeoR/GlpR transcriptional regulator n=1 Tax=Anaerotalea alkaliphila TaxID=2662126 RepID=A0A7X5HUT6_9FIRM|nr:DeoR/GlpR family DNA-binding transcription regulator [Anaerotalea alkaliphila]NDL67062.1 DeoR/GlpR transcriptional regulator [Anaerotalea alkaliphila]